MKTLLIALTLILLPSCASMDLSRDSTFRFQPGDVVTYQFSDEETSSSGVISRCDDRVSCLVDIRKRGHHSIYLIQTEDLVFIGH